MTRIRTVLFYGYLVAVIVVGIVLGHVILSNRAAIRSANRALCSLKADYTARGDHFSYLLRTHPHGTVDYTRAYLIERSHSYQRNIASLSDITCPKEAP